MNENGFNNNVNFNNEVNNNVIQQFDTNMNNNGKKRIRNIVIAIFVIIAIIAISFLVYYSFFTEIRIASTYNFLDNVVISNLDQSDYDIWGTEDKIFTKDKLYTSYSLQECYYVYNENYLKDVCDTLGIKPIKKSASDLTDEDYMNLKSAALLSMDYKERKYKVVGVFDAYYELESLRSPRIIFYGFYGDDLLFTDGTYILSLETKGDTYKKLVKGFQVIPNYFSDDLIVVNEENDEYTNTRYNKNLEVVNTVNYKKSERINVDKFKSDTYYFFVYEPIIGTNEHGHSTHELAYDLYQNEEIIHHIDDSHFILDVFSSEKYIYLMDRKDGYEDRIYQHKLYFRRIDKNNPDNVEDIYIPVTVDDSHYNYKYIFTNSVGDMYFINNNTLFKYDEEKKELLTVREDKNFSYMTRYKDYVIFSKYVDLESDLVIYDTISGKEDVLHDVSDVYINEHENKIYYTVGEKDSGRLMHADFK